MPQPVADDHRFMARALQLARRGLYSTHPNPRVGCVLVKDGAIIGEGWHRRAGEPHAEAYALQQAGTRARGSTAYITLEPCCHYGRTPPCTGALLEAGVARVVAAMQDPNPRVAGRGLAQLEQAGIAVQTGLLQQQAQALNEGFISRMVRHRPLVRAKLAMSLDGRTALASGVSEWITGPAARHDVQYLRAQAGAIMTGVSTVLHDDPALNVRLKDVEQQPLRVILDPDLKTPPAARTLGLAGSVLICTTVTDTDRHVSLAAQGADIVSLPRTAAGLDLNAVLAELARREINEVHLECGATLAGTMLQAELLDEIVVYMAPVLLGDSGRGLFRLPVFTGMDERIALNITDIRAVGSDWRIRARPNRHRTADHEDIAHVYRHY